MSLQKNLPKMFPKDLLDCELVNEENTLEIYLEIKRTTEAIRKKKEVLRVREARCKELQRFIQAKRLTGNLEGAKESLI
jgi:predicted Zn-ribbon and HTH transcriptional regulator